MTGPEPAHPAGGGPAAGEAEPGGARALRSAFGGLTTRGRSFLAAGLAAVVCAYLLGQPDLLRVGLLMALLPLVCVVVLHRTRHRVAGERSLAPTRVQAMAQARVTLRLRNVSRLPTGMLMLQDHVPYVLGPRPRFVLDRVEAGGGREVAYRVRSDLRGRYRLGPLQLRAADPFGMCELTRSLGTADTLTVLPRVEELPVTALTGRAAGHGESPERSLGLAGEDDVIPRDYRYGDDLRRVHWRSTARYGRLMVRREERPRRSYGTVLLDTRRLAYPGTGPDSAFEWAVSGAASVAVHLMEHGVAARLLTDDGAGPDADTEEWAGEERPGSAGALLDRLAVAAPSDNTGFSRLPATPDTGPAGLLVAFAGALDDEPAAQLAALRRTSEHAVAFLLDVGGTAEPAGAARLRAAGWTVLAVRPGDALAPLWQRADRSVRTEGTPTEEFM